jgi:hypothetical protein
LKILSPLIGPVTKDPVSFAAYSPEQTLGTHREAEHASPRQHHQTRTHSVHSV